MFGNVDTNKMCLIKRPPFLITQSSFYGDLISILARHKNTHEVAYPTINKFSKGHRLTLPKVDELQVS